MLEHVPATREGHRGGHRAPCGTGHAFEHPAGTAKRSGPPTSRRGRRTRPPPKASGASSGASAGGAGGEALGGRAHRRSAGRDPRHASAPRAGPTGRTESPEAARIRGAVDVAIASRHAGRHAPALRSGRARMADPSSGRMDRDGSGSAARRPTRKAREPSSTSGRGPPLLSGRSAWRTRIRTPACSASAPDAPWPASGAAGLEGVLRTLRPRRDGPRSRGRPGPPSPLSRSRAGGCPPTTLGASWPHAGPSPGSTGSEGPPPPRPSDPRRKAVGSPLTAFGLADGPERGDVRAGRGRHPSSLASFGPDRSDRLHVYR